MIFLKKILILNNSEVQKLIESIIFDYEAEIDAVSFIN